MRDRKLNVTLANSGGGGGGSVPVKIVNLMMMMSKILGIYFKHNQIGLFSILHAT